MSEVILEVKNISKSFQLNRQRRDNLKETLLDVFRSSAPSTEQFYALKDVSFNLLQGEVLGIIGKNGAGKSTLLRILSGITTPDEGEINFYGKAASILDVGAGFHPELTGRDNVYLAASLYGISESEMDSKFEKVVAFSEIEKFIDEPVKNYSAGMYLRLAFSVVAHIDADILIFDEVLGVGDASFQDKVNRYMLQQIGTQSFIIVSHNLGSLSKYVNRVLVIEHGKKVHEGSLEVIGNYLEDIFTERAAKHENANDSNHVQLGEPLLNLGVVLKETMVKAKGKSVQEKIIDSDAIELILTCENYLENMEVVFQLHDQFNNPLFATTTLGGSSRNIGKSETGTVSYTCNVPAYFFNKGIFSVSMFIVLGKDEIIYKKTDLLRFQVELNTNDGNSFLHRYPGSLKPYFDWTILK